MKRLRIYLGPCQSFYYFEGRLQEASALESLWILPVNRAVRIFKKRLVEASPRGVVLAPPVFTFDQLLLQIYQQLPAARRVINNDMLFFFVEEILLSKREAFRFFSPGAHISAGLVNKVGQMVEELRRFGYDGKSFAALPFEARDEGKSHDFELLLRQLETRLGEDYLDEAFARHRAAQEINEKLFWRLFPRATNVFVSGYGLFTPAMYLFLEKLSHWLPVHIKIDYIEQNEILFRHTASAVARFKKMGAQVIREASPGPLSRYLFNHKKRPSTAVAAPVKIYGLQNREQEVEFIAGKILELHRNQGLPLQRIGLTFANLERYVPTVRRIFKEFAIPFNLSTGFHLKQSPLIRLFLRTLRVVAGGLQIEPTLELLRSSLLYGREKERWDYDAVYRWLIPLRVKRLSRGWDRERVEISGLEHSCSATQAEHLRRQLAILQEHLAPFYDLPLAASAADFRREIMRLWQKTGLLDFFREPFAGLSEEQQENEFRAFNRFMKLFDKIFWLLDKIYGAEKITLSFIVKSLQSMINQATYNLKEIPDYGVQIMPRLEIQAVPTDVLIVGGMTDGEFPRASTADIFFNDTLREQMGLVASEQLLDQDRFLFYTLVDAPKRLIILTHPLFDEERTLVPSTFLSDLKETAHVEECPLPEDKTAQNKTKLWLELGLALQQRKFERAGELMNMIRLLHGPGTGQLKELLRRMQAATRRFIPGTFSAFEGWLSERTELQPRLQKIFADKSWSASRLEDYAFCPMRFFLRTVLQLEELPQLEEEISALERGSLIHRILFRFYSRLRDKGQAHQPARNAQLMKQIANEELERMPVKGFFLELERYRLLGTEQKKGLLFTFLANEQESVEKSGFKPAFLELAFGQGGPDKDPASSSAALMWHVQGRPLKINGRIDRVDVNEAGEAHIWDYKSGTSLSGLKAQEFLSGLYLQLPLYLLALKKLQPQLHPQLAGYYFVKDAAHCQRKALLADGTGTLPSDYRKAALPNKGLVNEDGEMLSFDALLQQMLQQSGRLVERILQGQFRHTFFPENDACQKYCPYKRICQKEKGKLKRMAQELSND